MPESVSFPLHGGCDCGKVRYAVTAAPLVVHCCHCRWCQRESGAAFALNAMLEASCVQNLGLQPELTWVPSQSGRGQQIARCAHCLIAVWSHYSGSGPVTTFLRVGTLDDPDALPPDVHIFVESKQPWVLLSPTVPVFARYYDRKLVWSAASLERFAALRPLVEEYRRGLPAVTRHGAAPGKDP